MNKFYCIVELSGPEQEADLSLEVLRRHSTHREAAASALGHPATATVSFGRMLNSYQFDSHLKHKLQCGCPLQSQDCFNWSAKTAMENVLLQVHNDVLKLQKQVSRLEEVACPDSLK